MFQKLVRIPTAFCTLVLLWGLAPSAIHAEEPAAIEEVVVTGSRIQRANLTLPNPVYGIDGDEIKASGELSVVNFLRDVPALLNSQNGVQANFFYRT